MLKLGAMVWFWPGNEGTARTRPEGPPWIGFIVAVKKPASFRDPWPVRISGWSPYGSPFSGYEAPYSPVPKSGHWMWPPKPTSDVLEEWSLGAKT
jgi:hypothetical protein